METKTAGIIIIGDEILKGQTQKNLRELGVRVNRISVIPDDLSSISAEVRQFSSQFDFVLTSGGIGPTHDDITFEGVGNAFDDKLIFNPDLVDKCKIWFKKDDLSDPCFKLAYIPSTSKLNYGFDYNTGKPTLYPLVSVNNVYIFPGIPQLLERSFRNLGSTLFKVNFKFIAGESFIHQDELSLTNSINKLVSEFPETSFGSYPSLVNQFYKTRISYECPSEVQLNQISEYIRTRMPVVEFDKVPHENSREKINELMSRTEDTVFKKNLEQALDIVEECFNRYNSEEVSVCYNGGKDCIVMLHLVHAVHQSKHPEKRLNSLYIREQNTFQEVDTFITESILKYKLENKTISHPMKAALKQLLEEDKDVKATVLGTRDGDPGAQYQDAFSPTDGDWPRIMRVNPILKWRYQDVWTFLRGLSIPYPSLYDQGYTSLGNPENTQPNPALRFSDEKGLVRYHPAYLLEDGSLERQGRTKK
ncbi:FAD synthase [Eurytemora carolleeae]|uniref:FAD synthase n=1 Tax=Eurytemora carolleeae TaxID=1294199 RepID=UPI000C766904|nr:FAD synthase [Eurytemora carolleeae]|eukprot:XP_023334165.1 FAD synthase-like [Eurytemora affinis]